MKILCPDPADAEDVLPGDLPVRDFLRDLAANHLDEFIMYMVICILQLVESCHMLKYYCAKNCGQRVGIGIYFYISPLPCLTMFGCCTHVRWPCPMVV